MPLLQLVISRGSGRTSPADFLYLGTDRALAKEKLETVPDGADRTELYMLEGPFRRKFAKRADPASETPSSEPPSSDDPAPKKSGRGKTLSGQTPET